MICGALEVLSHHCEVHGRQADLEVFTATASSGAALLCVLPQQWGWTSCDGVETVLSNSTTWVGSR